MNSVNRRAPLRLVFSAGILLLALAARSGFAQEQDGPPCDPSKPCPTPTPTPCDPSKPCPTPTPTPTSTPCDPSKPCPGNPVPIAELRAAARRAGESVATRVSRSYGRAENWNYNYAEGFRQGFANGAISDPSLPTPAPGNPEADGFQAGLSAGTQAGDGFGLQAGTRGGAQSGRSEATARFRAVLNRPDAPDTALGAIPAPTYDGEPGSPALDFLGQELARVEAEFRSATSVLSWRVDSFTLYYRLADRVLSAEGVYNRGNPTPYSFPFSRRYSSDDGYDAYHRGEYGGGYDTRVYRRLLDDQKPEFRRTFESEFEDEIRRQYLNVRMQMLFDVRNVGRRHGARLRYAELYDRGYRQGFQQGHRDASRRSFQTTYFGAYRDAFDQRVLFLNTHAELSVSARLVYAADEPALGGRLDIELLSLTNLGRVPFRAQLVLGGEQLDSDPAGARALDAPASTQNLTPQLLRGMARVKASAPVGREFTAQLRDLSGETAFSARVSWTVSWPRVLAEFSALDPSQPGFAAYRASVLATIRQEWLDSLRNGANPYGGGAGGFLGQAVRSYEASPPTARAPLRSLSAQILAIQSEGGGFHPFVRADYKRLAQRIR